MTLNELRHKIDEIDLQMKELFLKRMGIAEAVAENKLQTGDKILKPEREAEIIHQLTADVPGDLQASYGIFLSKLMEVSRTRQYRKLLNLGAAFEMNYIEKTISIAEAVYQGLPCSYSETAVNHLFPDADISAVNTFEDVFLAINSGTAQAGVVPLENTTAGGVYEVYDLLLRHDLYINACEIIRVNHCLAALPGTALSDIKTVYSHPQAIAQSAEFLKARGIATRESSNTAVAAKEIADGNDKSCGAVCSVNAAECYGLTVLAEGINHNKENATKFVAVSKQLIVEEHHDRIAVVFACPHRSGSLAGVLGIFGDYGVNLTEIHSRPDGKSPWEYLFYVDFTGNLKDEHIRALMFQLTEELPFVKIIGSYKSK
ncbi:MAG: chorismate mutase [Bacillota bacterium]|jgi:chorismate mutase/prephenate dehydratase|nr:chorismate mutase [Bacillota bacterium]